MDTLKSLFPLSFKYTKDVANLIIGILIYIVVGAIGGVLIGIVGGLPIAILGWAARIVGGLLDLYCVAGIVIQVLVFAKVLKD